MDTFEKGMRQAAFALVASFATLMPAFAIDEKEARDAAYASFRGLTKCAVTIGANEKEAVTFESFRTLYRKLCAKQETDFRSKWIGNSEGMPRATKMSEAAKMINSMTQQAFDRTREIRR